MHPLFSKLISDGMRRALSVDYDILSIYRVQFKNDNSDQRTHLQSLVASPQHYAVPLPLAPCRVLSRDGDPHVEFLEEGQVLKVKSVRLRDQGLYQCLARNDAGTQTRQFSLTVQGEGRLSFCPPPVVR